MSARHYRPTGEYSANRDSQPGYQTQGERHERQREGQADHDRCLRRRRGPEAGDAGAWPLIGPVLNRAPYRHGHVLERPRGAVRMPQMEKGSGQPEPFASFRRAVLTSATS